MKLEQILKAVEQTKAIPGSYIEYNGDLPDLPEITPDSFFGVKAVFNKSVPKTAGCSVMFKY